MVEASKLARTAQNPLLAGYSLFHLGYLRGQLEGFGWNVAEMEAGVAALQAIPEADRDRYGPIPDILAITSAGDGQGTLAGVLGHVGPYAKARALGERVIAATPPESAGASPRWDALYGLALVYAALGLPGQARDALMWRRVSSAPTLYDGRVVRGP